MKTKAFNPESISDHLHVRAIERRRPLTAMLELTYRCNFRCKMCYVRMTDAQAAPYGRMRTVEEWVDMARQLRDAGVIDLRLTGGECTQYPGFESLYEQLSQMGFRLSILSNAAAYTPSLRKLFEEYPPYGVSITLYGASNETYAAVTGDPKGFDKTMESIRFFQNLGVQLNLTFTAIQENIRDLPKINEISLNLGIPFGFSDRIVPHGRNPEFSNARECRLTPAQRVCVENNRFVDVEKALRDAEELEKELVHFTMPPLLDRPVEPEKHACVGSYCGCCILWNGEMHACLDMAGSSVATHPFEVGFEEAWRQMKENHAAIFKMAPRCQVCPMREQCDISCQGYNYANGGDFHEPDPEHCQYTWLAQRYRQRNAIDIKQPMIVVEKNCH